MCRKNQLVGGAIAAFGFGLLVGVCLEAGFFNFLLGTGLIAIGVWCTGKK